MNNHPKHTYTNDDFLQIIGHISAAFALLDFVTMMLICRLIDGENFKKLKIKDKTTLGQKLRILKKLEHVITDYPLCLSELKKILPEAIKIADERNRYIHDQWIFDERIASGNITRLRIKRKNECNINVIKTEEKTFNIDFLCVFLNQIISVQDKIKKISEDMPLVNKNKIRRT